MNEKYTREQYEADLAARQEREAREQQERQERQERESARKAWLADGGSEADFEKAWPGLRDAARKQRVVDADRRAREEMRSGLTSRI